MDDHVFICYSRKDEDFVLKLATNLKLQGVPVWLDQWDIPSGVNWDRTIEKALKECNRLLLVLSPASVDSDEVQSEWLSAIDEKKVVIPILYQPCQIPRRLKLIQNIDFTSRSPDDEQAIGQILNALKMARPVAPLEPPPKSSLISTLFRGKNIKVAVGIIIPIAIMLIWLTAYPNPDFSIFVDPAIIQIPINFAGNLTYSGIVFDPVNAKNETLLFSTPIQTIWLDKVSPGKIIIKCKSQTTVYVRNTNWLSILGLNDYVYPVVLDVNSSELPSGISWDFSPAEARPDFDTILQIETFNLTPGRYPITIYGRGGDGRLRTCTCFVDIKYRTRIISTPP
jgi:hypothetical protein